MRLAVDAKVTCRRGARAGAKRQRRAAAARERIGAKIVWRGALNRAKKLNSGKRFIDECKRV